MSDILNKYKKLPDRGQNKSWLFPFAGFGSRIFLGQDNLLCVYRKRYEEEYRRFYFKDIQAITIRKNRRDLALNAIFAVLSIIFIAIETYLWPISVFFLFLILINWLLSPTCTCHIQTAVSKEKLPSLNRIKKAQKIIDQIIPFIEKEQGKLERDEIITGMQKLSEEKSESGLMTLNREISSYNGTIHKALFPLLLLSGFILCFDLYAISMFTTVLGLINTAAMVILVIVALVKQPGSALRNELRILTWMTMGYLVISGVAGYAFYMYLAFKNPNMLNNQWEMLKIVSSVSVSDYPVILGTYIVFIVLSFSFSTAGLFFARKPTIA